MPGIRAESHQIPLHSEAWAAMAIGYVANPAALPVDMRERDLTPRQRKPASQFVFTGGWDHPAPLTQRSAAPSGS